jgi:hypothetical protein
VVSENAFTQILVGRLMGTSVAEYVKPDEDLIFLGLLSKRGELKKGALAWAKKYAVLPAKVKVVVADIASDSKGGELAKEAKGLLK